MEDVNNKKTMSTDQHSVDQASMATDDEEYVTVKKRVGGGFKYVNVKVNKPAKDKDKRANASVDKNSKKDTKTAHTDSRVTKLKQWQEKNDSEESEKMDIPEKDVGEEKSPMGSFTSISLPFSSADLRRENTCEGKVRYEDYPILKYIQDNVIGHNITISGPFGPKLITYCDYTASGRSLSFIEDYIRTFVCPFYANTHSETGRNARQTSKFREEARSIIRKCVNAGKDDVVIFTGSGATAGLHKIAWGLKISQPRVAEDTVVLIGPYEHHANMLLWKEFGTTVVRIKDGADGLVDMDHLAQELKFWKEKRRHMLVCISAASNVTGIQTNTDDVAKLAHKHGALVAFDYAGGGPYMKIDMNQSKNSYVDAVVISPHKFVGGPGSPGVVVAKKWVFKNNVPDRVGGGTVVYVSRETHSYTTDIEAREEGGTPAIIESIRTGLAFQLKDAVSEKLIAARDEDLCCRAFSVWERNPNLIVLGSHNAERLTIFSFIVKHEETGKFVHYNFISTLLNDLFGIQSRGGCACAGPYGHDLLGITEPMAKRLKWFTNVQPGMESNCLQTPMGIMRPGFVRVNLPYFYDDTTIDYVINAVDMVVTHGWKLLPLYTFNPYSGAFVYKGDVSDENEEELFSLADIDYSSYRGKFHVNRKPPDLSNNDLTLSDMLQFAENVFREASDAKKPRASTASRTLHDIIPKDKRKLRWFLTPQEASDFLTGDRKVRRYKPIMTPRIDSRLTETDSAPETFRSLAADTAMENTTDYGKPKNKPRRFSETAITKDTRDVQQQLRDVQQAKVGKLNLDGICEECDSDKVDRFRSKMQYSQRQPFDSVSQQNTQRTAKRSTNPFSFKEGEANKVVGRVSPRRQTQRISLPRLS